MTVALFDYARGSAEFDGSGAYRYSLSRQWVQTPRRWVLWLMLNPSTATADADDPTIANCGRFSRLWGFDGLRVANIFGLRSTDPMGLLSVADPVGPDNNAAIEEAVRTCDRVVTAWGSHAKIRDLVGPRASAVLAAIWPFARELGHLGTNKDGQPKHPLYLSPSKTQFQLWKLP